MSEQNIRTGTNYLGQDPRNPLTPPAHYPPKTASEERLTSLLMGIIMRLDRIEKRLEELNPQSVE